MLWLITNFAVKSFLSTVIIISTGLAFKSGNMINNSSEAIQHPNPHYLLSYILNTKTE